MRSRLMRMVALLMLTVLLAGVPGLVGCAGEEAAGNEIVYGWLWDYTGRAAVGVTQVYQGFRDYLRMVEETDPIPGVQVKLITYDTKSDASRVMPGYMSLKAKGADIMTAAPHDTQVLRTQFEADQMPFYSLSNMIPMLDCEWLVSLFGPPESQVEAIMHWIMDTWDGYPDTKPRVGFVGLAGVPFYEGQRDTVEDWVDDNPTKFNYVGAQMAPTTTTLWSSEISKLEDTDFIVVGMSGPPLASFLIQSKQSEYQGRLAGPLESVMAFWSLVKGSVPEEALDGIVSGLFMPWWNDTGPFMTEAKEYAEKYHSASDLESIYLGTGQFNGWSTGMIFVDALRRAVADVGADNVTGKDLFDALKETDIDVEEYGNPWKITAAANCYMTTVRLYEYDSSVGDFVVLTDWYLPPSLGG
jgi:hypothetical protein